MKKSFSKNGEVISCQIHKNRLTGKNIGTYFANFDDKISAIFIWKDAYNLICKGENIQMKFVGDKKMTIVIKDVYKKEVLEKVIYIIMREVFLKKIRKKIIR